MKQLELFPDLPLGLRPPRRLRVLGFSLECLNNLRAENADLRYQLERNFMELKINVAEAKLFGHVIPDAYGCAVRIEDARERITKGSRRIDELRSAIDRDLVHAVEQHLKRCRHGACGPSD